MTPEDLIAFEKDIAAEFEAGNIKAPVHLAGGNESHLIEIFRNIRPQDWVLCQWRSHYHCLLKGVAAADVKTAIVAGRSIALCFPAHRILATAIVGGVGPIATGLAWSIKRRGGDEFVHVFLGDMTAETGIIHEAMTYSFGHCLPVIWHVEDNGKSVCTNTGEVWGRLPSKSDWRGAFARYEYDLTWPHVGIGKFVKF